MSPIKWPWKPVPAVRLMWEFTTPEERREMSASQELRTLLRVAFVRSGRSLDDVWEKVGRSSVHARAFEGMLRGNFYILSPAQVPNRRALSTDDDDAGHFRSYEGVRKADRLYTPHCIEEALTFLGVDIQTRERARALYAQLPRERPLTGPVPGALPEPTEGGSEVAVSAPRAHDQEAVRGASAPLPEPSVVLAEDTALLSGHVTPEKVFTPQELRQGARELYGRCSADRRWAEMAKRSYWSTPDGRQVGGCSPSTLNGVVSPGRKTRKVPTEKTFAAFLRACGVAPKQVQAWMRARKRAEENMRLLAETGPPEAPAGAPTRLGASVVPE